MFSARIRQKWMIFCQSQFVSKNFHFLFLDTAALLLGHANFNRYDSNIIYKRLQPVCFAKKKKKYLDFRTIRKCIFIAVFVFLWQNSQNSMQCSQNVRFWQTKGRNASIQAAEAPTFIHKGPQKAAAPGRKGSAAGEGGPFQAKTAARS